MDARSALPSSPKAVFFRFSQIFQNMTEQMTRCHPSSSPHSPHSPRHPSPSTPPELRNARIEERTPSYLPLANGVNISHLHLHLHLAPGFGEGAGLDWVTRAHHLAARRGSVSFAAQRAGDDVLAALGLLSGSAGSNGGNGGGNGNGGGRGNAYFDGDSNGEVMLYHDELCRRGRRGVRTRRSETERERDRLASQHDRPSREARFPRTSSSPTPFIGAEHLDCARCNKQRYSPRPRPLQSARCTCGHDAPLLPFLHSLIPRARPAGQGEYIRLRPGGGKAFVRPKKGARGGRGLGACGTVDGAGCEEVWVVRRDGRVRVV